MRNADLWCGALEPDWDNDPRDPSNAPQPHIHIYAPAERIIAYVDGHADVPAALEYLRDDYGVRAVTIKRCWGYRCD